MKNTKIAYRYWNIKIFCLKDIVKNWRIFKHLTRLIDILPKAGCIHQSENFPFLNLFLYSFIHHNNVLSECFRTL